jgi:hypothetical protein
VKNTVSFHESKITNVLVDNLIPATIFETRRMIVSEHTLNAEKLSNFAYKKEITNGKNIA